MQYLYEASILGPWHKGVTVIVSVEHIVGLSGNEWKIGEAQVALLLQHLHSFKLTKLEFGKLSICHALNSATNSRDVARWTPMNAERLHLQYSRTGSGKMFHTKDQ